MLTLNIPEEEAYDYDRDCFVTKPAVVLRLEHSLLSVSKWESVHHVPFMGGKEHTADEISDYIRCMDTGRNPPEVFDRLKIEHVKAINDYISDKQTATTISSRRSGAPNRELVTSELVYYWMTVANVPFECEKWNINRLLVLLEICSIKNNPKPNKVPRQAQLKDQWAENQRRLAERKTKG